LNIDVYGAVIHLILTSDVNRSARKIDDDIDGLGDGDKTEGYFIHDMEGRPKEYFIVFPHKTSVYFVAHECLHCTFKLLDDCDVKYNSEDHEAFTYLHGYIFEQVYERIKKFSV
jgi:hypothetical protein